MSPLSTATRRLVARAIHPRTIPSFLLALVTAITAACGSHDSPSAPVDPDGNNTGTGTIVGSYSLQQIDGRGLPVTIFDDDVETEDGRIIRVKIAVTNGSLDLNDRRFSGNLALRLTAQGQSQDESIPISGEYRRSGNAISFESDEADGPSFQGSIRNGRLELELDIFDSGDAVTYTFRK